MQSARAFDCISLTQPLEITFYCNPRNCYCRVYRLRNQLRSLPCVLNTILG